MPRDADMDRRLHNWARWRAGMRNGGLGFARADMAAERVDGEGYDAPINVPTIDVEAMETDDAVAALTIDLRSTVGAVYLGPGSIRRIAAKMSIAESTVHARISTAHAHLRSWLSERAALRRAQRERVEALQRSVRP